MLLLMLIASLNSVLLVLSADFSMVELAEKSEKMIGGFKKSRMGEILQKIMIFCVFWSFRQIIL